MDKKNDFKKLFRQGFSDSERWTEWYFSEVFSENNAMITYSTGLPACCLMLDNYKLKLAGAQVNMAYISCATTAKNMRGRGHMSRLISDALMEAAARDCSVAALLPASERLYFFYDRFGFATVFYTDQQRYTSLHRFTADASLCETEPTYDDFHSLEMLNEATVLHSRSDFDNILADNRLSDGSVIAIADRLTGRPAAMLFASWGEHTAVVHDLLTISPEATDTILSILRQKVGQRMMIVNGRPSENPFMLKSRGMLRIVDAYGLLSAIAAEYPDTEQVIRLHDDLIPDNNGIFIIHGGKVERSHSTMRRITLDVPTDILAKIIFNSRKIGRTFAMPSFRPSISLMLD